MPWPHLCYTTQAYVLRSKVQPLHSLCVNIANSAGYIVSDQFRANVRSSPSPVAHLVKNENAKCVLSPLGLLFYIRNVYDAMFSYKYILSLRFTISVSNPFLKFSHGPCSFFQFGLKNTFHIITQDQWLFDGDTILYASSLTVWDQINSTNLNIQRMSSYLHENSPLLSGYASLTSPDSTTTYAKTNRRCRIWFALSTCPFCSSMRFWTLSKNWYWQSLYNPQGPC